MWYTFFRQISVKLKKKQLFFGGKHYEGRILITLDFLIVVVHGDYFLEKFPQNTSLLQWLLLLIFSSFPNTTIITLKNFNNSGQRVSKFPQNFSKCPHNTIIPLSILNIFLKSPQNTLIPQTLLLRRLE